MDAWGQLGGADPRACETRDLAMRTLQLSSEASRAPQGDRDLDPGEVVDGKLVITAVLGRGAMGTVYAAEHRGVGRQVAVKVLAAALSANAELKRRFAVEARSSAAISHPGVVQVLDTGELPDGRPFIVMERVRGRSLLGELTAVGKMPLVRACRIVRDVARAVAAAHAAGVVHRDLKPENILVDRSSDGEVIKVLDFGIAGRLGQTRGTAPGTILGTPEYMAPEQVIGSPDPALDIYALGAVLFELLVGRPPFEGRPFDVIARKASESAPRLEGLSRGVPIALAELVAAALAIDPDERPASASFVADRLEEIAIAIELGEGAILPGRDRSSVSMIGMIGSLSRVRTVSLMTVAGIVATVGVVVMSEHGPASAQWTASAPTSMAMPLSEDRQKVESLAVIAPPTPTPGRSIAPTKPSAELPPEPPRRPAPGRREARASARMTAPTVAPTVAPIGPAPAAAKRPGEADDACARTRRRAADARATHDWNTVLRMTEEAACWRGRTDRDRLRTQALMETERFRECADLGSDLALGDSTVARWVRLCTARQKREP